MVKVNEPIQKLQGNCPARNYKILIFADFEAASEAAKKQSFYNFWIGSWRAVNFLIAVLVKPDNLARL